MRWHCLLGLIGGFVFLQGMLGVALVNKAIMAFCFEILYMLCGASFAGLGCDLVNPAVLCRQADLASRINVASSINTSMFVPCRC